MAVARQRIRLPKRCWREALGSLASGDLWEGDAIADFEHAFSEFTGVSDAVAVASGRAGLRFLLQALELPSGAEIICSAFGYPVVPYIAKELGFRLTFVDCEMQTLGLDPKALEQSISSSTAAVIATHLYGVPCQIDEISGLAKRHGAALIEDCAHCCGAAIGGRRAGAFGTVGYFSFETSKPINTMGGGMVTTSDPELAARVRKIAGDQDRKDLAWLVQRLVRTSFEATVTHPWIFAAAVYPALRFMSRGEQETEAFASGYHPDNVAQAGKMGRYTNYQAKLGLAQLALVPPQVERRRVAARRLIDRLQDRVTFQQPAQADSEANYMLVTALFPDAVGIARKLLRLGIDTKREYMRDCGRLFGDGTVYPNAARAEREVLHLPAHPELGAGVDRVSRAVEKALAEPEG